jgi:hypothetical protein
MTRQRDLLHILEHHAMRAEASCVPWAYEFVAKWHCNLPIESFPIQDANPRGLGFSAAERDAFKTQYGIILQEHWVPLNGVLPFLKAQCDLDLPPVLSIFSRATVLYDPDPTRAGAKVDWHMFVGAAETAVEHFFASRCYNESAIAYIYLTQLNAFHEWSRAFPDSREQIHCITHQLV